MKRCYYEILDVEKKATSSEIKSVTFFLFRPTEKWLSNITLIKIPLKKEKKSSYKSKKHMMSYQTPMKEHSTIITDKKYSSIKTKCQRKISNSILLVSTFGSISLLDVSKATMINKDLSIMSTEMFSKKSKPNKPKPSSQEMTWKKTWENIKALEYRTQT